MLDEDDVPTILCEILDEPGIRMNDGGCDPQGRFWCGTMAYDVRDGAGSLYRVEADGSFATALAGVTISNGLGWSPDGATAFYVDSMAHGIDRFAFDGDGGELGERRRFAEVDASLGLPDGLAVDAEGGVWVALWDGGAVRRYAPDGDARRGRAAALRAGHRLRVRRRRPLAALHHDVAARAAGRRRPGGRLALPLRARRARTGSARVRGVAALASQTLSTRQLNRATLARQLLLAREPIGPVEAIGRLCGLQAQEAAPPFIGLWTRLDGFEREHLLAALRDREVVRATLMRATLHLLGATDYAAFRCALMPVMERAVRVLGERAKGLEPEAVLPAARELLLERPRGFNELRRLLQERFPAVNDRALGYTVRTHVPLVMVPTDAPWGFPSVADFALADEWLGRPLPEDGTPEQLVLRYLAAFGPASAADAQTWSGLQGLAPVLEALRPQLLVFKSEGSRRELFDLPGAPRPDGDVPAPARFLPEFDNLVLAHADRTPPGGRRASQRARDQEPARARDVPLGRHGGRYLGAAAHARRRDAGDDAVPRAAGRRGQGADCRGRGAAALRRRRCGVLRGSDHAGVI